MKVSHTVLDYIRSEVTARIHYKYEADRREAKRQMDEVNKFCAACFAAAVEAYNKRFDELFPTIADFAKDNREKAQNPEKLIAYNLSEVPIKNRWEKESVHMWDYREREEVNKLTKDIVIELELGGNKERLMELLSQIGETAE